MHLENGETKRLVQRCGGRSGSPHETLLAGEQTPRPVNESKKARQREIIMKMLKFAKTTLKPEKCSEARPSPLLPARNAFIRGAGTMTGDYPRKKIDSQSCKKCLSALQNDETKKSA